MDALMEGKKKAYIALMPAEFAKKLKRFELQKIGTYKSRLQPSRWKPPKDNPVSAVRIRAWFQNFAISNGIPPDIIEFIVGHRPVGTGQAHYWNNIKHATENYEKIVDKFPIPP